MKRTASYQRPRRGAGRTKRIALLAIGGLSILFILVNIVLGVLYRDRTYPRTNVTGTSIGSHAYASLSDVIGKQDVLPKDVTLTHGDTKQTVALDALGISKSVARTVDSAREQRSWLPIINFFTSPTLQAPIKIDGNKLLAKAEDLAKIFQQNPANAHLKISDGQARIIEAVDGYALDKGQLQAAITAALDNGKTSLEVPTKVLSAKHADDQLQNTLDSLNKQLATSVTFAYGDKTKQVKQKDRGQWYVRSGSGYALSRDMIRTYVTNTGQEFGIRIQNVEGAVDKAVNALKSNKAATITLTKQTVFKTYRYCTAVRGVDASALSTLREKLHDTYNDNRGWSLDGQVAFTEVSSDCDYTVWLSASSQMTSFGGVCDPVWSCRSGNNVVLNYTRWTQASPAWNANSGSLDQYRDMLINHETGHWLGFGHRNCGGAGQPAPVMQQQSIDLQGCTFSSWPNAAERATLKQSIGL